MKSFYFLSLITYCLFNIAVLKADDTVKLMVGTQTFLCEFTSQLNCKAVNQLQQKEIQLKKDGAKIQIEDKARSLSAEIQTSLSGANVIYEITLCSVESCSISNVVTNSLGSINQTMSGQYNITQKTFYVLALFVNSDLSSVNLEKSIIAPKLTKYLNF